jgi:peptidylprolyl isomerase
MQLPKSIALALAMSNAGCVLHRHAELPAAIPHVSGEARVAFALREIDVALGAGASAEPRKCFFVHYTGWLTNGTKFDSSRDTMPNGRPRQPISFPQGFRRVIAGWDLGFEGMRVGGRRRLFIPYQLAYGEAGRPPIPPKAELIFDVELMAVTDRSPRRDRRIRRRRDVRRGRKSLRNERRERGALAKTVVLSDSQ